MEYFIQGSSSWVTVDTDLTLGAAGSNTQSAEFTQNVDTGKYKSEVVGHFQTIINGEEVTRKRVLLRPIMIAQPRVIQEKPKPKEKKVFMMYE